MRKLILIKHARPQMTEGLPSDEWPLSAEGRAACGPLAEVIRPHDPRLIVTSREPKALETARLVADALGRPVAEAADLHEHDRGNVPIMQTREFISMMALFFKDPQRLVLGRETADQAARRIERAIDAVLLSRPGTENLAIVTHGTVLALFAAAHGAGEAFQLWRQLGLPSAIAFSLPDYRVVEMIPRIP